MRAAIAAAGLAALSLAGCAGAPAATTTIDPGAPDAAYAYVLQEHGAWRLTPWPPRFPLSAEATPPLTAMAGAGTSAPFGCGVDASRGGYFSGPYGSLVCALTAPDGSVRVGPFVAGDYVEVHDSVSGPGGQVVLAQRHGGRGLEVLVRGPAGTRRVSLPGTRITAAAAVLPSGAVAVLHDASGECRWSVFQVSGPTPTGLASLPGEGCGVSDRPRVLRDQMTGAAYLSVAPLHSSQHLYRLDALDSGRAPAELDTAGMLVGDWHTAGAPVVFNGVLYFLAGYDENRGTVIGIHDLDTGSRRRVTYAGPGPRPPETPSPPEGPHGLRLQTEPAGPRFFGFALPEAPGEPPRVVIIDRRGLLQVHALDLAAAVPVA